jgi:hypothetical protein
MPDLIGGRLAGCVTRQAFLAGFQEVLRPAVIEVLVDPLTAAQLGDTVLTTKAVQDNSDLLFCRKSPTCGPADISDDLLRRLLGPSGFLSHLHSLVVTMSQKSSPMQSR